MTDEAYSEIEGLVKRGDVAEAAARLAAVLSADPEDDVAKLLYGTCAQLLGNASEFGRIHAELRPRLDEAAAAGERSRRMSLWEKYRALASKLAMPCMAVASSVILCGCYGCPPMDPADRAERDNRAASAPVPGAQGRTSSNGGAPVPGAQDAKKDPVPAPAP